MIQFVVAGTPGDLIADGTLGHIQTECLFPTNRVSLHPDQLNPPNARILPGILSKSLCLPQIVHPRRIMWFQNIYDIIRTITPDNQKIRVGRLCLPVDLIGDAERP